jgi:pimeloyl-ACP methyl ester carboxylesterase
MGTTAPDGTVIATTTTGTGPPLVLVGGTTYDAASMAGVAAALADSFTCVAVDRRGRGGSGDGPAYAIEREYEDVAAVVAAVRATLGGPVTLVGHSYGAFCSLGAIRLGADVERLVLYEPPILVDGPHDPAVLARARELLRQDDPKGTLIELLRGIVRVTDDELAVVTELPDAWFEAFAMTAMREIEAVGELSPEPADYTTQVDTLLLVGSESPDGLVQATHALAAVLPHSRIVTLEGQAHNAILAAPELVATAVRSHALDRDAAP